jgi:hypothetical protein
MALPTITEAMADAYFATTPRNAAWTAATNQPVLLSEAQTWLNALCWDPKTDCCGNEFDAAYTRAVSELALALHQSPTALIGGAASTAVTGAVKRQKLGDMEVEYHPVSSGSSTATAAPGTTKGPLVLRTFPWLRDIIGCWVLNSGSNQLVYRVRS